MLKAPAAAFARTLVAKERRVCDLPEDALPDCPHHAANRGIAAV